MSYVAPSSHCTRGDWQSRDGNSTVSITVHCCYDYCGLTYVLYVFQVVIVLAETRKVVLLLVVSATAIEIAKAWNQEPETDSGQ